VQARERLSFSPINRRKFIQLSAAGVVGALGVDAFLIEPNIPRVIRKESALKRWPSRMDGFTIALLSDFHYDSVFSAHPIRSSIDTVNALRPDLIALTGDFVTAPAVGDPEQGAAEAEPCADILSRLKAKHGLWAVLGNHDLATNGSRVSRALEAKGIQLLTNRSIPVEADGGRFWLSGVDDVIFGRPDLDAALHGIPSDEANVLLAHEPDYADEVAGYPIDLQLSGHSHGGQVRFPLVPPLFLPELGKKYIWGLYKIGPLTLYTNAGIGTVRIAVRFNCPPEITLITLRRAAG
jgi:predicted MPP superfamily phosphohydrolase